MQLAAMSKLISVLCLKIMSQAYQADQIPMIKALHN